MGWLEVWVYGKKEGWWFIKMMIWLVLDNVYLWIISSVVVGF